ncbi:TnsD family Tn7-like transposition protein, partial [Micrococcus sp. SIMBA_144]
MSNNGLKIQKFNSPPLLSESKDKLEIIAEESLKLINLNSKVDISQLQKSYRYLLQINGYASYTGKVDQRKLAKQFNSYYGEELLSLMDSNVDINNNSCWLKAITRK